jgi:nucleoside-diphosphate-sugar epimerase
MTDSKASSQFIKKALAHEDIILKSEGNQLFSYTYITDAVRAMLHVLIYGEVGTAYNISCESCDVRLKEFAGLCAQYNDKDVIFELPSETERKGFSVAQKAVLDNSRLRSIGWTPLYNMKEALWRTLDIIAS